MDDIMRVLQRAILGQNKVTIMYESDGVFSQRNVKPEYVRDGKLRAYCYLRKTKRTFSIPKILAAHIIPSKEKG